MQTPDLCSKPQICAARFHLLQINLIAYIKLLFASPWVAGVGVFKGELLLLRLIGSSSSPREKNWAELDVTLVAGAAGEEGLTKSLWLMLVFCWLLYKIILFWRSLKLCRITIFCKLLYKITWWGEADQVTLAARCPVVPQAVRLTWNAGQLRGEGRQRVPGPGALLGERRVRLHGELVHRV